MKNILLILALFAFVGAATAQNPSTGYKGTSGDTKSKVKQKGKNYNMNYSVKNLEARYKFGEDSLNKFIYAKLYTMPEYKTLTADGHVLISFEVNYDGKPMNFAIIEGTGSDVDIAIKNIIMGIKDFLPAQQNGIDYRSEIIMDIPVKNRN